jgi:hypothetical protein
MRRVRRGITKNFKVGKDFREYDKFTFECRDDDVWVVTETPIIKKPHDKQAK